MSNLRETLEQSRAVGQDYHDAYASGNVRLGTANRLRQINESLQRMVREDNDTYEVQPDLSPQDLRTLYKIINRQLPDCGRKRGAILRYIKAYTPEPKPQLGFRIVQHLNNL